MADSQGAPESISDDQSLNTAGEPVVEATDESPIPSELHLFDGQPQEGSEVESEIVGDAAEVVEVEVEEEITDSAGNVTRVKRKRRVRRQDATELKLRGRRALCRPIADIAPQMLKTAKLRILGRFLDSTRGLEDEDLTAAIKKNAAKLSEKSRVLDSVRAPNPCVNQRNLKAMIIGLLLQEETYSLDETRLEEKVAEYEKEIVKRAKSIEFFDAKKQGAERWHQYDTYRIVLETAWSNDDTISEDENRLLCRLREHLSISDEEHWLIGAYLKRFPKMKCVLHTADEVNEARKELQRDGLVWSYRDESNRNIDVIPCEIATVIRQDRRLELQRTNFRRLMSHDSVLLTDLRDILLTHHLDRYGNKSDLIERIISYDVRPSEVLNVLDRQKLSGMCAHVGQKSSGNKPELIERLIDFYDDLTFEERVTKDPREVWYNNYELLAARGYNDLRAKKLITKDLDIEHLFERATEFLFEVKLGVRCDVTRKDTRADGRIPLDEHQTLLWDCKSVEVAVNLQDFLDTQFDGYLRREREAGKVPLAFLVIGPAFTPQSLKLAHQYKAKTNWDVALVTADGLKHLADQWSASARGNPFPVRLLNRTEIIDRERADFLLSLA